MVKRALLFAGHSANYLARLMFLMTMVLVILGAAIIITLRYWVLPDIERYHDQIESVVAYAIGQKVEVGRISADWNGLRPRLSFSDTRIFDPQGQVALSLPHVENVVGWSSLLTGELRLYSLEIEAPDLLIRRDLQGQMFVAGMPLSSGESSGNLSDWLLHQSHVEIRQGRLTWLDEQRQAPALTLNNVAFSIENGFFEHRFSVKAVPPEALSGPMEVRGNFQGSSFSDLKGWAGELFVQLDYADVGAWKTWVALPRVFRKGKGALRAWVAVDQGRVQQVTADVSLGGVQTRLTEDLPVLDLQKLHGRIGWRELGQGFEVTTRNLVMRTGNGFSLKPTDFYLRLQPLADGHIAGGEVRTNAVDIGSLGSLLEFLPLGEGLKQQWAALDPRGRLADVMLVWQEAADRKLRYEIRGKFDNLAVRHVGRVPGFTGLSGQVDGRDSGGSLVINSRTAKLDAPEYFSEVLAFDKLGGQIGWQRDASGWQIKLNNAEVANDDMEGNLYGTFQLAQGNIPIADLTAHLNRARVEHVARYIPLHTIGDDAHAWLRTGLQDGHAEQVQVRLRGDLRDFPFAQHGEGVFKVQARIRDAVVDFLKPWPRIERGDVDFSMDGGKIEARVNSAVTQGINIQKAVVTIPDMLDKDIRLRVRGEVYDDTANALAYIRKSPVRGFLSGLTDDARATGKGRLNLFLDIPLMRSAETKLQGSYHFDHNDFQLEPYIPTFETFSGDLSFTESAVYAHGSGQVLGGAATLSASTDANGIIGVHLSGHSNVDAWRKVNNVPLAGYFQGGADWRADVEVRGSLVNVAVHSDLAGMTSNLPSPFNKNKGELVPLHFEMKGVTPKQDNITIRCGKLVNAQLQQLQGSDGVWRIARGNIVLGDSGKPTANRDGIWISGTLPYLSMEGWQDVSFGDVSLLPATASTGEMPKIAGVSLEIGTLAGFGVGMNGLHVGGFNRDGALSLQIQSRDANGDVLWQPDGQGKLSIHFKTLSLVEMAEKPGMVAGQSERTTSPSRREMAVPEIEASVDHLNFKGRQLGKLDFMLARHDENVQLKYLHLTNPDASLSADGQWDMTADRTSANLKLAIADAGKILARSGYPDSVQGGSGTLESKLVWQGSPMACNLRSLDGSLRLNSGKGRFLKVNLGAGKLLGVMSLQALPKRVALDFTDIFSEGFQFDSINGNAQIVHGILMTNDFNLAGSTGRVTMKGQVNLNDETQNLHVSVLPNIGDSVSLLAYVGGPVVGTGVLLANKLLRDPLDKLVSFDYNVTGSWEDPKVEKAGQSKPEAAAGK